MTWSLDPRLEIPENRDVLAFIRGHDPSAHSDVADALVTAAVDLPGVRSYCPDAHAYAYVALHTTAWRVFGLAFGQTGLVFRLPENVHGDAFADRGTLDADIGREWVAFQPFPVDERTQVTRARLRRWCKTAFEHACA